MRVTYDKAYLSSVRKVVGRMFDLLVNSYGFSLEESVNMTLVSHALKPIEIGDIAAISGKSGTDFAWNVVSYFYPQKNRLNVLTGRETKEFWFGAALTGFQWRHRMPFSKIIRAIPPEQIMSLYAKYERSDYKVINDALEHFLSDSESVKQPQNGDDEQTPSRTIIRPITGNKIFKWNKRHYLVEKLPEEETKLQEKYFLMEKTGGIYRHAFNQETGKMVTTKSVADAQRYVREHDCNIVSI